jgi:hypothetical protein
MKNTGSLDNVEVTALEHVSHEIRGLPVMAALIS